jgi:hypothetical protein
MVAGVQQAFENEEHLVVGVGFELGGELWPNPATRGDEECPSGGVGLKIGAGTQARERVLAGGGFEPTTSGL